MRNGKILTTDGPYAETKEQLGGYYVVEAADLKRGDPAGLADPGCADRLRRSAAHSGRLTNTPGARGCKTSETEPSARSAVRQAT